MADLSSLNLRSPSPVENFPASSSAAAQQDKSQESPSQEIQGAASLLHGAGKYLRIPGVRYPSSGKQAPELSGETGSVSAFFNNLDAHLDSSGEGNPALFFSGITTQGKEEYRDFYLNLAVMHHFAACAPEDIRIKLAARAMTYLVEFSPMGRPAHWKSKINPLQQELNNESKINPLRKKLKDELKYSRYSNAHMLLLKQEIARIAGFFPREFFPITDETALHGLEDLFEMSHDTGLADGVIAGLVKDQAFPGSEQESEAALTDSDPFQNGPTMEAGRSSAGSVQNAFLAEPFFSDINELIEYLSKLTSDRDELSMEAGGNIKHASSVNPFFSGINRLIAYFRKPALSKDNNDGDVSPSWAEDNLRDVMLVDLSKSFAEMPQGMHVGHRELAQLRSERNEGKAPGASEGELRDYELQSTYLAVKSVTQFIRDALEAALIKSLECSTPDADSTEIKAKAEQLMSEIDRSLVPLGLLKFGRQTILYVGAFCPREMEHGLPKIGGKASEAASPIKDGIDQMLQMSGHYPLQAQVMENWAEAAGGNLDAIFRAFQPALKDQFLDFPADTLHAAFSPEKLDVRLPADGPKLCRFDAFDDVFAHQDCVKFDALQHSSPLPMVRFYASCTVRRLQALKDIPFEDVFSGNGLQTFLQFSYNRMICAMQNACEKRDKPSGFMDQIRLIHEEIKSILTLSSPYTLADFSKAMHAARASGLNALPPNMTSRFHLRDTGMSCLDSIRSACIKQKEADTNDVYITIVGRESMFFQNETILEGSYNDLHCLDSRDLDAQLDELRDELGTSKIDLFVCHFHSNVDPGANRYASQDVAQQVAWLIENDLVAPSFTVAVDETAPDDTRLIELRHQQDAQLKKGKRINIVTYWSSQKYDFFGLDNYNGGVIMELNDGAFPEFSEALASSIHHSDSSLQGITFLQKAHEEIAEYRGFIVKAAARMNNPNDPIGFPADMHGDPDNESPLQVVPCSDDYQGGFVNIRCREGLNFSLQSHFWKLFECLSERNPDLFLTAKSSFGFPSTNVTVARNDIRLTPGLEGDEQLKRYRDYIVCMNDILKEQEKSHPAESKKIKAFERAFTEGMDLLELKVQILNGEKSTDDMATLLSLSKGYQKIGNARESQSYKTRANALFRLQQRSSHQPS